MKFRPIIASDYTYFRIPPLPSSATGWVMEDPYPVGFTAFDSVPGLPHIGDLYLFVLPSSRNLGYGSGLLKQVCAKAKASGITQLSTPLVDVSSPFADFLRNHAFFEEHSEIELAYTLPAWLEPADDRLVQYSAEKAAPLLRQLYNASFGETAWYQPYDSDAEIFDSLHADCQAYFLLDNGAEVGFALVRIEGNSAEIEPFGIVSSMQHQGYGRRLMEALLHEFVQRNLHQVQLTVWEQNLPALALYESFGFQGVNSRTFLAKNL